jgi:putative endonuclease
MPKPPQKNRVSKGKEFEARAAEFLISQGYMIRERNWRTGHLEIDLIAVHNNTLVFVEVKGSRTGKFGHPAEWVDTQKKNNLYNAAQMYIVERNLDVYDFRFDVITFYRGKLEHYPDAFRAESA